MARKRQRSRQGTGKGASGARPVTAGQQARYEQAARAHAAGQLEQAEAGYRELIAEQVRHPELYCRLAHVCAVSGRRDEAERLLEQALEIDPKYIDARMNLADSYRLRGDVERAADAYRRVIADLDDFHVARYLLGNVLKSQGKLDEAAELYQQVMERQPDYTQAHFTYSGVHRYADRSDPHIDAMLELYRRPGLPGESKIHLAFGLAKAFEDIGDFDEAFGYLKAGNDLRFGRVRYDIGADRGLIESIVRSFSREAIDNLRSATAESSDRPIFIVGMPRSGTSLVEKILASHSTVYGAGELEYLFALGTSSFLNEANHFEFEALDNYPATAFERIGKTYLEKIAALGDGAAHVTDKMPFNAMMIGIIRIALPNAKIVHCVRDARDTCLSIYRQNFTTGNYRFAYNLKSVAQFHNLYRRLMEHWHETLPGAIYDVSYEALTHNPEQEIRALLSACNLEFEDACLAFQKTRAVVTTASAVQVRQPMYTSSVGLWRNYEKFLQPMLEELAGG